MTSTSQSQSSLNLNINLNQLEKSTTYHGYIGYNHHHQDQDQVKKVVICECGGIGDRKRSARNNDNFGRWFYTCPNGPGPKKCRTFVWESDVFPPAQITAISHQSHDNAPSTSTAPGAIGTGSTSVSTQANAPSVASTPKAISVPATSPKLQNRTIGGLDSSTRPNTIPRVQVSAAPSPNLKTPRRALDAPPLTSSPTKSKSVPLVPSSTANGEGFTLRKTTSTPGKNSSPPTGLSKTPSSLRIPSQSGREIAAASNSRSNLDFKSGDDNAEGQGPRIQVEQGNEKRVMITRRERKSGYWDFWDDDFDEGFDEPHEERKDGGVLTGQDQNQLETQSQPRTSSQPQITSPAQSQPLPEQSKRTIEQEEECEYPLAEEELEVFQRYEETLVLDSEKSKNLCSDHNPIRGGRQSLSQPQRQQRRGRNLSRSPSSSSTIGAPEVEEQEKEVNHEKDHNEMIHELDEDDLLGEGNDLDPPTKRIKLSASQQEDQTRALFQQDRNKCSRPLATRPGFRSQLEVPSQSQNQNLIDFHPSSRKRQSQSHLQGESHNTSLPTSSSRRRQFSALKTESQPSPFLSHPSEETKPPSQLQPPDRRSSPLPPSSPPTILTPTVPNSSAFTHSERQRRKAPLTPMGDFIPTKLVIQSQNHDEAGGDQIRGRRQGREPENQERDNQREEMKAKGKRSQQLEEEIFDPEMTEDDGDSSSDDGVDAPLKQKREHHYSRKNTLATRSSIMGSGVPDGIGTGLGKVPNTDFSSCANSFLDGKDGVGGDENKSETSFYLIGGRGPSQSSAPVLFFDDTQDSLKDVSIRRRGDGMRMEMGIGAGTGTRKRFDSYGYGYEERDREEGSMKKEQGGDDDQNGLSGSRQERWPEGERSQWTQQQDLFSSPRKRKRSQGKEEAGDVYDQSIHMNGINASEENRPLAEYNHHFIGTLRDPPVTPTPNRSDHRDIYPRGTVTSPRATGNNHSQEHRCGRRFKKGGKEGDGKDDKDEPQQEGQEVLDSENEVDMDLDQELDEGTEQEVDPHHHHQAGSPPTSPLIDAPPRESVHPNHIEPPTPLQNSIAIPGIDPGASSSGTSAGRALMLMDQLRSVLLDQDRLERRLKASKREGENLRKLLEKEKEGRKGAEEQIEELERENEQLKEWKEERMGQEEDGRVRGK